MIYALAGIVVVALVIWIVNDLTHDYGDMA
jgi:hypothetical protein